MLFLRSIIVNILLLVSAAGFSGMAFAEPTATDLNIRGDAQGGVTREGYIDSFKS